MNPISMELGKLFHSVQLREDECDIRAENASENLALAKELFAEDAL